MPRHLLNGESVPRFQLIYTDSGNFRTLDSRMLPMEGMEYRFGNIAEISLDHEESRGDFWSYKSVDGSIEEGFCKLGWWYRLSQSGVYATVIDEKPETIVRAMHYMRLLIIDHPIELLPTHVIDGMLKSMVPSVP